MTEQHKQDPQAALAQEIAEALVGEGLVPASHAQEVQARIASGRAAVEDWNLWVELVADADKEAHDA